MKFQHLLFLSFLLLVSCSPQMSAVWQKENHNTATSNKIAVIAIDKKLGVRQSLEQSIVKELRKDFPNKDFVTGLSLIPPNAGDDKWSADFIETQLQKMEVNTVLTACIIDSYNTTQYRSGNSYAYPVHYRVGNRIHSTYRYINSPDYYEQVPKFVLQSTLYDMDTGQSREDNMYWIGESSVTNPSSVENGAASYADNLVKFIISNKLLK